MANQRVSQPSSDEEELEFQVIPDLGMKSKQVDFVLGMPINQVVAVVQQNARHFIDVHMKFSKKYAMQRDICLAINNLGIRLYFDAASQLLKLIQIDDLSKITLRYGNTLFSRPGHGASLEIVNECFGSTHPGAYDEKQKMYVQSWPGLSFCFPTDSAGSIEDRFQPGYGPNLRSLKFDPNSTPRVTKMAIYRGSDLSRPAQVDTPYYAYCGQNRTRMIEPIYEGKELAGLSITFDTQNGVFSDDGEWEVFTTKRKIYFGDSVSDVSCALGAPSKTFYKSDDKMKIHKGASRETQTFTGMPHFFFNYFTMGLDVLFDFVSKRVIKFVLHSNVPGHPDFGIYTQCNFAISMHDQPYEICTRTKFDDIRSAFIDPCAEKPPRPVVLQRHGAEPFGSMFCYGVHQIVIEVMENGHIPTVTLYDGKL